MGIIVNPTNYKFKIGETLEIKFNSSITYGYLYGIGGEVINSTSIKDGIIIFDALKEKGDYKGCYIGGYLDGKWTQSNEFNISIENSIIPTPPKPTLVKEESKNCCLLKLLNTDKKPITLLKDAKEIRLERELKTSDEKLSFSYPINSNFYNYLIEESYIRTKENEFILKEIHELDDWTEFTCILNVEDMEGKVWDRFESVENSIVDALNLAIVGTGWRVENCNVTKKRTVRKTNCSSWDIVQDIKKTYMVDMQFDCINKKINIYEHLGNDKGVYFIDSLNIRKLETQRDSYNFYTRLIPIGKDGLTIKDINNGKDYVENYQYSKKVKTFYWKDDRYTVVENLKKDAQSKLNELSKPRRAYKVDINNLSKSSNGKYEILNYSLGDTITLISKSKRVKEKQRIVKITEYLLDHSKDTVEIANTILSFEEIQQELQEAAETVSNITTDNGTVDGSCVDNIETKQISDFKANVIKVTNLTAINADIENLHVKKADIQDLNVVRERVGTLEATTITTTELKAVDAKIDNLESSKATITDLSTTNAKVKVLESDTGNIQNLLNGNLTSQNIQSGGITSDKLTIFDAFIKNAMIDSIDINKMNAGIINTKKIKLESDDGNLTIRDNTIQIKDSKNVRVQIGKDASNNYGIYVWDVIGKLMFSSDNGLTEEGIKNKIIRDDMISDEANIQAYKLDINSVFREMNNNSNTLNATRIKIDSENQTLDMAFSKLKTTTEENKKIVQNALTKVEVQQGQIKATIENSKIIQDKQKTLEDNYNRTVATVDSINNELGSHKSILDTNSNKISSVETKTNTLERNLDGMKERVSSFESTINEDFKKTTENVKNKFSELQSTIDSINLSVDDTKKEVTTQIKDITKDFIRMEMYSSDSNIKTENDYSNILFVKVLQKDIDITTNVTDKLKWLRISEDSSSDIIWNDQKHFGNTLRVTKEDLVGNTEFKCILLN